MIYQRIDERKNIISGEDPKTPEDFENLKNLGIKYVLSLQMGVLDFYFREYRNFEAMQVLDKDMLPVHLMMSNVSAPTFQELDHALKVLDMGNVYFHCRRGKDRTGMVRAAYRILKQGSSFEDAYKEMCVLGHAYILFFWWKKHLRRYISEKVNQALKG